MNFYYAVIKKGVDEAFPTVYGLKTFQCREENLLVVILSGYYIQFMCIMPESTHCSEGILMGKTYKCYRK